MFDELQLDVELKLEAEWTLEVEAEDHQRLHVVHIKLKLNKKVIESGGLQSFLMKNYTENTTLTNIIE